VILYNIADAPKFCPHRDIDIELRLHLHPHLRLRLRLHHAAMEVIAKRKRVDESV
jgi:hypothetical protein